MSDKKISALTADTTPTTDDYTITVASASGDNKKVTLGNAASGGAVFRAHWIFDRPKVMVGN